jgi:hypothetical protein
VRAARLPGGDQRRDRRGDRDGGGQADAAGRGSTTSLRGDEVAGDRVVGRAVGRAGVNSSSDGSAAPAYANMIV